MSSRRVAKVAEALRECISTTVLFGLKDPRVQNVTVLRTEVSPDLRTARVYVSVLGDEKTQSLSMHGLRSARGFIQSQIADRLELRYTPILKFVLDPAVKLSTEASSIIRDALDSAVTAAPGASEAGAGEAGGESVTSDVGGSRAGDDEDGSTSDGVGDEESV
jgi:ribosome-binding factor A